MGATNILVGVKFSGSHKNQSLRLLKTEVYWNDWPPASLRLWTACWATTSEAGILHPCAPKQKTATFMATVCKATTHSKRTDSNFPYVLNTVPSLESRILSKDECSGGCMVLAAAMVIQWKKNPSPKPTHSLRCPKKSMRTSCPPLLPSPAVPLSSPY